MAQKVALGYFDLETLRLGYYQAVRAERDGYGKSRGYSVIGQPSPWPRREASIAKLVECGLFSVEEWKPGQIELMIYLTDKGHEVYNRWLATLHDDKARVYCGHPEGEENENAG